ncbi:hypothetical protein HY991_03310 [Candidatus Micrarchaeota archaeon]|nr:hypothetical protein [Candidatus Micrarchaeota archaeon]
MVTCKICEEAFVTKPDTMVICEHRDGAVHIGCCVHKCSWDKKGPVNCKHAKATFKKIQLQK